MSIDSGELRVLVALDSYGAQGAKLSPNGKFLAYDLVQEGNKDIFILSINEDAVTRLTNSPAEDVNPLWSPHGKNILFRSKRRGSWDLWGIGVNNGKAAGTPFLVKSNIGEAFLSTWTSNGKLLYGIENSMQDIYVVAVDLVSGMVTDPAYQFVKSYSGKNLRPMWSYNGKHLTYVSTRHDGRRTTACSLNLETGEEREIRPDLNWIHTVRLSPNGEEVAVTGLDKKDQRVAHLISLETGEEKILIQEGDLGDWLPDGDEIIVWKSKPGSILKEPGFYSMNVKNGELKQIFTLPSEWAMSGLLELSPNGKKAFALVGNESGRALWILPFDGSNPEEILKCNRPANIATPTWSPDGKKIAYLYIDDMWGESEGYNIWVISVVGGVPKKLDITVPGKIMIFRPAWSPDGTKIAFTIDRSVSEAWVMENFLPITETKK
ncbi:MAG: hypothetical protein ACE5HI_15260 [bacterium]